MKILVIGAGVSGLFFANFMADSQNEVTLIEKNDFGGRKLLATGNGRCNFTNINQGTRFYQSENSDFPDHALENFTAADLIAYFEGIGMISTSLPSGRCYPATMSSKTVRDVLILNTGKNTRINFAEEVLCIDFDKKKVKTSKTTYSYDKLVIGTGGMTLKNSGSDGKIFGLIKDKFPITQMTYGITNFETKERLSKTAKGTKITGRASLMVDGNLIKASTDDIIFQDYGLTGTAILDISNDLSINLAKGRNCQIEVDFLTDFTDESLLSFIKSLANQYPDRNISEILIGLIHEKLIGDLVKISKINQKKRMVDLNDKDWQMLVKILKHLSFEVSKIHDTENAQVTIGGVDTRYVNPRTFASTIETDVHFIGEILDVSGDCGGYNIQWAASSAKACADFLKE